MFGFLKKSVSDQPPAESRPSWTDRLKAGLSRTRTQLASQIGGLFKRRKIDEDLLEELETTLLMT